MLKRERVSQAVEGEAVDRVPVALWRYWPGDDQRSADFARALLDFQVTFDWDCLVVAPPSTLIAVDLGAQDARRDDTSGDRGIIKPAVSRSLAWTELRTPDPSRGNTGKYYEALRLVMQGLINSDDPPPVLATVHSPLAQAARIAGGDLLLQHLRTRPDRLHTGLNTITEGILRFTEALRSLQVAGVYYIVEHADHRVLSETEYMEFGHAYDRKILETLPSSLDLNMVAFPGISPMLHMAEHPRVQAVHWPDAESSISLVEGKSVLRSAVCGGLSAAQHLDQGTPTVIRDAAREAIAQAQGRRLILSAGQPVPISTPLANLRAAREAVH